jgi:NitT/TauT family transport system substrate-binding protein
MERSNRARRTGVRVLTVAGAIAITASLAGTGIVAAQGGDPEKTDLIVAIPFPDYMMYEKYLVAADQGYFGEPGLNIEVITADDTRAAVASGSADIGVVSAGSAMQAIDEGLDIKIVGSHNCRQRFSFATRPDITELSQLDGRDVTLAGTAGDPAEFERRRVLAESGWDLDEYNVSAVYPGPDSATWLQFFLEDRIALMPFFQDDIANLKEAGANIPVDDIKNWPNDLYVVSDSWLAENPNTLQRFFEGTMQGIDFIVAPGLGEPIANKDAVIEIMEANDFDMSENAATDSVYAFSQESFCPNLYYDEDAWNTTMDSQGLDLSIPFADATSLEILMAAQAATGRDNSTAQDIPWPPEGE